MADAVLTTGSLSFERALAVVFELAQACPQRNLVL